MSTKVCGKCGIEKSLDEFSFDKTHGDGKASKCKNCASIYNKTWRQINDIPTKPPYREPILGDRRTCKDCEEEKSIFDFPYRKDRKTGRFYYAHRCKKCANLYEAEYRRRTPPYKLQTEGTKVCAQCGVEQAYSEFYPDKRMHGGRRLVCKSCLYPAIVQKWYTQRYGISVAEVERLLVVQNNKCAICGDSMEGNRNINVDHNHQTGEVRGLLCRRCNTGIGLMRDNLDILRQAIKYLGG